MDTEKMFELADRLRALRDKKAEAEQDYTSRLALQEEAKTLPFTAGWDMYCLRQGAPVGDEWLKQVKQYEKDVQFKRG